MTLNIHVLAWDMHKHVAVINRFVGSQIYPVDNWISNDRRLWSCRDMYSVRQWHNVFAFCLWTTIHLILSYDDGEVGFVLSDTYL